MHGSGSSRSRKRVVIITVGGIGLAAALTVSAFVAPARAARDNPTYTPTSASHVVATVPPRDPDEIAARQALTAAPDRIEIAVALAKADIQRYRKESDPRYLGHAQATLARWWKLPEPPPEVLLVRATIQQSIHE
nr:hypothetical protein [Deltaproteobacteria bacterium]